MLDQNHISVGRRQVQYLLQHTFNVSPVIANHSYRQCHPAVRLLPAHFCNRYRKSAGQAILESFNDTTLVLQAIGLSHMQFQMH